MRGITAAAMAAARRSRYRRGHEHGRRRHLRPRGAARRNRGGWRPAYLFDAVWGIGLAADDPRAQDPEQWPGRNLLGFALMRVRAELR